MKLVGWRYRRLEGAFNRLPSGTIIGVILRDCGPAPSQAADLKEDAAALFIEVWELPNRREWTQERKARDVTVNIRCFRRYVQNRLVIARLAVNLGWARNRWHITIPVQSIRTSP